MKLSDVELPSELESVDIVETLVATGDIWGGPLEFGWIVQLRSWDWKIHLLRGGRLKCGTSHKSEISPYELPVEPEFPSACERCVPRHHEHSMALFLAMRKLESQHFGREEWGDYRSTPPLGRISNRFLLRATCKQTWRDDAQAQSVVDDTARQIAAAATAPADDDWSRNLSEREIYDALQAVWSERRLPQRGV